jgi:hypothetical protein
MLSKSHETVPLRWQYLLSRGGLEETDITLHVEMPIFLVILAAHGHLKRNLNRKTMLPILTQCSLVQQSL